MFSKTRKHHPCAWAAVGILILINMSAVVFVSKESTDPAPHHYTEDITYHTLDAKENLHVNNAENNSSQATSHEAHFGDNCQVPQISNKSTFSHPSIVPLYSDYALCIDRGAERIKFIQASVGPEGSFHISNQSPYHLSPPWTSDCGKESSKGMLLYLVLSIKRGIEGSERRMRARRLWAGELGGAGKYLFVVPRYETGEENGDILEESEEYQDILQTDLRLEDTHFHSKQVISSLYFSYLHCSSIRYSVLLLDDVFINPAVMSKFAAKETYSSNRIYGTLYRGYTPARTPSSPHHTTTYQWPWQLYPPFLGSQVQVFSEDTIPLLLQAATKVPLLKHWEVWLTGLVSLSAEVIRMGVRDFFSSSPSAGRPDCYWAGRGAVWGVGKEEEVWIHRVKNMSCPI